MDCADARAQRRHSASRPMSALGYAAMALLAVQFGLQPILYKEFAATAKHSSVLVVACETCKFLVAGAVLLVNGDLPRVWKTWSFRQSLAASGLPACTYAVQNVLVQIAYQSLPPIVFNLVNQTKLLWTALFVYLLLGKRFSAQQCLAMVMLLSAAVLLSLAKEPASTGSSVVPASFQMGLLTVMLASILSGFGAATTQKSMQHHQRDTALVTMELAFFGSVFLFGSMAYSSSSPFASITSVGQLGSLFDGWTSLTWIPIIANAMGGLLVGAVTKYVGGVLKSFALVIGIAFTAFVESYLYGAVLPFEVWIAAALVTASMFLYNSFPYVDKEKLKSS